MGFENNLNLILQNVINSPDFHAKLSELQQQIVATMQDEINEVVYLDRKPEVYKRTWELLNSVTASPIQISNGEITFKVYLDPSKMNHESIMGNTKGEKVYVPALILQGHQQEGYDNVDYFRNYPEHDFMKNIVERVKDEIKTEIKRLFHLEIKKIGLNKKHIK